MMTRVARAVGPGTGAAPSGHDPLADFRDLSRADRRPDRPGGRGLVIAEGAVVVRRLLASPYPVRAVLGTPRRCAELADELAAAAPDAPVHAVDAEDMAGIVGFHLNRGVLASADRADPPTVAELLATARRVAVLEGIGDHENLGALFRNAAALGVDGVLVGPGCADPLYRRSVRVSMGHVLGVPFATTTLDDAVAALRAAGFTLAALTPDGAGDGWAALAATPRLAVLLGSEGPGLSAGALAAADRRARIPMTPGVDSLNVATAAAVAWGTLNALAPTPAAGGPR